MRGTKSYAGIDYFRMVAAVLVVAIHTSPLLSFHETADFVLTRVIARVGVPFFLMTSGFFLITRYRQDGEKLKGFVKKTALLYGVAIVLYLPLNWYNGYFNEKNFLPRLIQDLVFDGTMYHLWYLPASILGGAIAWYLMKKCGMPTAFLIAGLLYLVGLGGDSYYGAVEGITLVKRFYDLLFQIFDYTRNGLFFAPIFFLLAGWMAEGKVRLSLGKNLMGLAVSFGLMLAEALLLHHFRLQRHDSMYLFLVPCMYFLFGALLQIRQGRVGLLRTAALLVYLIHPMVIVIVRLAAKKTGLWEPLVENSLGHFVAVLLLSGIFSLGGAALWERRKPKGARGKDTGRAWIELDLKHLVHNVEVLKELLPEGCRLMAVVKTQAYGHGAFAIASHLERLGVDAFAVATIDEGIQLRSYGIRGEILVLGYTAPSRARELKKYDLTQTLIDFSYAAALNRQGVLVKCHLKIDTGMHRLGVDCRDAGKVKKIFRMRRLKMNGIFTHLCCADSLAPGDVAFTRGQINDFYGLLGELTEAGIAVPKVHIQSSYGLLNHPELSGEYVRVGIALYGVLRTTQKTAVQADLRPVLALKTRVAALKDVPKGESVGYGRVFTAARDSRIAILPIGYGDGLPRILSGAGGVRIRGQYAPIAGRICMDQMAVDVTELSEISLGDVAVVICNEADCEPSAPVVAEMAGTISNELLCRLGARLPVVVR